MKQVTFSTIKVFRPTQAQRDAVQALASQGVERELISKCIFGLTAEEPIDLDTLNLVFAEELELGESHCSAKAIQTLVEKMNQDGPDALDAAIFWLQTQEPDMFGIGWSRVEYD